jgi:hypothetical protein
MGMHTGPLYELAVELSPKAARIAALLLVADDAIPAPLRRSLGIALSASGGAACDGSVPWAPEEDPDATAARRFVAACLDAARRLPPQTAAVTGKPPS